MAADLLAAMAAGGGANGVQSAWSGVGKSLGGILGGGGNQESYYKGADQGLSLVKKQFEASKLRDEAMARDSTMAKLVANGMDPDQAAVMTNIASGGQGYGANFSNAAQGMDRINIANMRQKASVEPDVGAANTLISALSGKVRPQTSISGGNAYNPTVTPDKQTIQITPDAAADNMRDSLVDNSQIYRNRATGDAAVTRAAATGSSGKPKADPVAQYARKKRVDEVWARYETEMEGLDPAAQSVLAKKRDSEIATITAGSLEVVPATEEQDLHQAVGMWAEDMKAAGFTPSAGQLEEAKRRLKHGQPLRVEAFEDSNDGTRPPQVIEPSTGKPVTGGPGDKPGNSGGDMRSALTSSERKAGLPPRIDYENGGYVGASSTARAASSSIPEAAAAKLKEGAVSTFGNGQKWTKRNGIPVRVQ